MDSITVGGYTKMPVGWIVDSQLLSMYLTLNSISSTDLSQANKTLDYTLMIINRDHMSGIVPEDDLTEASLKEVLRREVSLTTPKHIMRIVDAWNLDEMYDISIKDLYSALSGDKYEDVVSKDIDKINTKCRRLLKADTKIDIKVQKLEFPKYKSGLYPEEDIENKFLEDTIAYEFCELFRARLRLGYYLQDIELYYNYLALNITKIADHIRKSST